MPAARTICWSLPLLSALMLTPAAADNPLDRTATQFYPYVEWQIGGVEYAGNPFDIQATATFTHTETGAQRQVGMFYDGAGAWRFRFNGDLTGEWSLSTSSTALAGLDGLSGTVQVSANPDPVTSRGFLTNDGNFWAWSGSGRAIVPQFVMAASPDLYYNNPEKIAADVEQWIGQHGFTGLHVPVYTRWFDINHDRRHASMGSNPNPDPRTFQALEALITAVYEAGGSVHLWIWGDEDRQMTPIGFDGGINGPADQRMQRYLADRLGALPGWSAGYGFDLWEWAGSESGGTPQMEQWHAYMHDRLGWPHILGARQHGHDNQGGQRLWQMTDQLDYSGFETHQPSYEKYIEALLFDDGKPAFMEDRFRVRTPSPYPDKDYTLEMVRRGLWHSMMAGGIANIWGYEPDSESQAFPNKDAIKTWSIIANAWFDGDLIRANALTDGVALFSEARGVLIAYKEDAESIWLDLSGYDGPVHAFAQDTLLEYSPTNLILDPIELTWQAPYASDWVIVIVPEPAGLLMPGLGGLLLLRRRCRWRG